MVGPHDDEKLASTKSRSTTTILLVEVCGQSPHIINIATWESLPKHYRTRIVTPPPIPGNGCCALGLSQPAGTEALLSGGA